MDKEFKTIEEAEDEIGRVGKPSLGFCPIIKDACNPSCVCYCTPRIEPVKKIGYPSVESWRVNPVTCRNPMVSGEIYVYNQN